MDTAEKGLIQRVRALNDFIADLYGAGEIMRPASCRPNSSTATPASARRWPDGASRIMSMCRSPASTSSAPTRDFYVLEDNARTPSGVSYMLENREVMMRLFPDLFAGMPWRRSRIIPRICWRPSARSRRPPPRRIRRSCCSRPGQYNSAFYEHSFLADKLGVQLVEGRDLFVEDNMVYMRTTEGPSAST